MKKRLAKALALLCYILALGLLFGLDLRLLFRPLPFLSVVFGMFILTACQFRRHMPKEEVLAAARWNLILAAFLTTLISFFASGDLRFNEIGSFSVTQHLLPLLYASIIYVLLGILLMDKPAKKPEADRQDIINPTSTETAERVFRSYSLTRREYHVAHKILQDMSNKEIAADLYISEATVKKHIQNIYQKCGASDRASFRDIYHEAARKIK